MEFEFWSLCSPRSRATCGMARKATRVAARGWIVRSRAAPQGAALFVRLSLSNLLSLCFPASDAQSSSQKDVEVGGMKSRPLSCVIRVHRAGFSRVSKTTALSFSHSQFVFTISSISSTPIQLRSTPRRLHTKVNLSRHRIIKNFRTCEEALRDEQTTTTNQRH